MYYYFPSQIIEADDDFDAIFKFVDESEDYVKRREEVDAETARTILDIEAVSPELLDACKAVLAGCPELPAAYREQLERAVTRAAPRRAALSPD